MGDRAFNPWWFALWVAAASGVGYYTGGRLGATEGALVAVILAHGALIEALRDRIDEIEILRAKLSQIHAATGNNYER